MKKLIFVTFAILFCVAFSSCSDNKTDVFENETDNTVEELTQTDNSSVQAEDSSLSGVNSLLKLEDVTTEYVEPTFKTVSKLSECYNYFEAEENENVTTENNADGTVSRITLTDKDGNTKAEMNFKYEDEIIVVITYYLDNDTTEKVYFSFYDENTINIMAYSDSESKMSIYLYNKDGTFNSYIDSSGFSSLLANAVMGSAGNILSGGNIN